MSLILSYLKQQGAKSAALQKIVDEPNDNKYPGALGALFKQSNPNDPMSILNQDMIEKVYNSWAKDADLIKQVTDVPTMVTGRSFTVNGPANTSTLIQVTPGYIGSSFKVFPSQHMRYNDDNLNRISMGEDAMRKLKAVTNGIVNYMEDAALAKLQAIKTKVVVNPLTYSFVGDSIVATNAQRKDVVSSLDILIKGNNYEVGEVLDVVGDPGALQIMRDIREFGANNSQDQAQRLDGKEFFLTNRMPLALGKQAAMFAIPMGSFAVVFRVQPLAKRGYDQAYDWKFDTLDGRPYGIPTDLEVIARKSGADVSADTGNAKDTASVAEEFIVGVEFAIIEQFEASDAGKKTPVLEVLVNTAETDADTTAPTVTGVTSADLTDIVLSFSEAMAIDAAGDVAISEASEAQLIAALSLTEATPAATIDSVTASADNTELTVTLASTGSLAAADSISATLYDGAGNAFTGSAAQVNAGATAWEAIP